MEPTMLDDLTAQLVQLEHRRCLAITNADIAALKQLNSDDLTYTHTGGQTEDLQSFLTNIAKYPREITRGDDLTVRIYGDVAVLTGTLHATFPARDGGSEPIALDSHALQVWVRQGDSWKQSAFAASAQLPDSLR
jgi:ketosteroid isomerase-like protein